eukprot:CAMPEP_0206482478 /NCGR_PEP_ID=MMETSP0324_2-20121206/38899_1 /ASSEMBLY_ACC=CAM_ASM_000836 /TAXON_ID=2866 /ORGANISM="Crypthecodinium cohnii, Strain Seligo" /LENGTH=404 /DNA_ID=CAMNT_0053960435 /DNA_START=40 /DNA_END=1254 /DNA_ORIENTATION=-
MVRGSSLLALAAMLPVPGAAMCPGGMMGTPPEGHAPVPSMPQYNKDLADLDIQAVFADIKKLMTSSEECWPADFAHYGPFWVRLAWHCSGTYRESDGRGGCGGGRQRFDPEASWADNANLDQARGLLAPIKEKYGDGLSWGDLFTNAGTLAIQTMGGPVKEFCFGRIDEPDGTGSLDMGPSPQQEKYAPCPVNGLCEEPLGTDTIGLIYVNPEGVVAQDPETKEWKPDPNPARSASHVREVFARMGWTDEETIALIGGGHAFGKSHGACPLGAGKCGSGEMQGKGNNTFTSGMEGPWTTAPTVWDNEFFRYTLEKNWEKHLGPGGHWQWRIKDAQGDEAKLMRLTTDMSIVEDPAFKKIVEKFASDQAALDEAFSSAWFKLVTNGGRWSPNKRCVPGSEVELVV